MLSLTDLFSFISMLCSVITLLYFLYDRYY